MAQKKKKKGTKAASEKRKEKLKKGYPLGPGGRRVVSEPPVGKRAAKRVAAQEAAEYGKQMETEKQRVRDELGI